MSKITLGARHFMYPMPSVLVGANVGGKPNFLVAAWTGVIQATPPLIYASIRKERYTLLGITENQTFSICVPSSDIVTEMDYCGIVSGHDVDKSRVFTTFYGKLGTAPMIEECPICMECRLVRPIDFEGTHIACVGEVVESYVEASVMDGTIPDAAKVKPIIFTTDGKYWSLGDQLAQAYNVGLNYEPVR